MHTVKLTFELEWSGENLSPKETDPEIRVFFDSRLIRDPIKIKHSYARTKHTIEGRISTHYTEIPNNTHIALAGFAWRKNSMGSPCLMDIGTNHIQLQSISDVLAQKGAFVHKMPLLMRTTTEVDAKEYVTIKITKKDLIMGSLKFSKERINSEMIGDSLNAYINMEMNVENQLEDTIPGTSRIRVPSYIGEAGLELTNGIAIPAVGFVISETPKTNELFWTNAFTNTLKRDGLIVEDWKRLNIEGKCRTTLNMLTQLTQAFDYVSDTVDKNTPNSQYDQSKVVGIEQFSNSNTTGSGDCEDGGASEKDSHTAFTTLSISGNLNIHNYLREAQELAKQYIPCMSLDAVNGAAVADNVQHIGAHLNDNFIPIHLFQKWMSHSRIGRKLVNRLPWDKSITVRDDIPFAIGEGTGPYDAIGYHNPYANANRYVTQIRGLSNFRTTIEHERGKTTSFFIGSLTGLTDYFINRGYNIGSFLYGTKKADGTVTRGAYYDDMINHPEKIALIMHDKIPPNVMSCIRDSVSIRVPPEPLILKETAHVNTVKNKHLDYICNQVASMGRSSDGLTSKVNVYVRDYQINEDIARSIVSDISSLQSIISVTYYQEKYSDTFYGYNMQIECAFDK